MADCSRGRCVCQAELRKLLPDYEKVRACSLHETRKREQKRKTGKTPIKAGAAAAFLKPHLFRDGKAVYCTNAVHGVFKISKSTLLRWGKQAAEEHNARTSLLTAEEVLSQERQNSVVLPEADAMGGVEHVQADEWLRSLPKSAAVTVRNREVEPKHGLKGKPSNRSKESEVLPALLEFCEDCSAPNGNTSLLSGPLRTFRSDIRCWECKKLPKDANEEACLKWRTAVKGSLVYQFNDSQKRRGDKEICPATLSRYRRLYPVFRVFGPLSPSECKTCARYRRHEKNLKKRSESLPDSEAGAKHDLAVQASCLVAERDDHRLQATADWKAHDSFQKFCFGRYSKFRVLLSSMKKEKAREAPIYLAVQCCQSVSLHLTQSGDGVQQGQPCLIFCPSIYNYSSRSRAVCLAEETAVGKVDTNFLLSFLEVYLQRTVEMVHELVLAMSDCAHWSPAVFTAWAAETVRRERFSKVTLRVLAAAHCPKKGRVDLDMASIISGRQVTNVTELATVARGSQEVDSVLTVTLGNDEERDDVESVRVMDFEKALMDAFEPLSDDPKGETVVSGNLGVLSIAWRDQCNEALPWKKMDVRWKEGVTGMGEPAAKQQVVGGAANEMENERHLPVSEEDLPFDLFKSDEALKALVQVEDARVRDVWHKAFSGAEERRARQQFLAAQLFLRTNPGASSEEVAAVMESGMAEEREEMADASGSLTGKRRLRELPVTCEVNGGSRMSQLMNAAAVERRGGDADAESPSSARADSGSQPPPSKRRRVSDDV